MSDLLLAAGRAVLLLVCVATATGCQRSGPALVAVSGRVTLDGDPVTGALVTFMSTAGKMASSELDANGQYHLHSQSADGQPGLGAPAGRYVVLVLSAARVETRTPAPMVGTGGPQRPPASPIPERYQRPDTSGLNATVEEPGPLMLDFALFSH